MYIAWWLLPSVVAILGLGLVVRGCRQNIKGPRWVGAGPVMLPNLTGAGSVILGAVLFFVALAFVAGHYFT